MTIRHLLSNSLVATACLGTCLPTSLASPPLKPQLAGAAPSPRVEVVDVRLAGDSLLCGQVLDPQGKPMKNAQVEVLQGMNKVAISTTDSHGRFAVPVRNGGVYVVAAGNAWGAYRVWSAKAAPPASRQAILLVAQSPVLRGQGSPLYNWIAEHPYLFYAGVATAIVVPLVVVHEANKDDDAPASP